MQIAQSPSRQELLRSMSKGFQKTESSSTWWGLFWLFLGLAVFTLILFGISTWQNRDRQAAPNHPGRLFSELSRRLGLNRVEQHILKSIAAQSDCSSAAELLMSPGIYDAAARRWHRSGPGSGEAEKAAAVRLRTRLFGAVEPSTESDAAESDSGE